MKVATVLGTRPEIIRLALVVAGLDRRAQHVLIDTNQNHHPQLSAVMYRDLGVRRPDRELGVRAASFAEQAGQIMLGCERAFVEERPDRVLILGDTNSGLAAVVAKRMGIPVFHMEAGNRCFDDRVPEEVNRRIIDHSSDVLMPYTERSRANLLREGIAGERIFVTGNPIGEVIDHYRPQIGRSDALARLGLARGGYLLATIHRAENVDVPARLEEIVAGLDAVARAQSCPLVVSTHPRTREKLEKRGKGGERGDLRFLDPFGFFDFIALEEGARAVLTDSGTVQEECAILKVPVVTVRDTTERPETVEWGGNIITGVECAAIAAAAAAVLEAPPRWEAPPEYRRRDVCETVLRIVLGHHHGVA